MNVDRHRFATRTGLVFLVWGAGLTLFPSTVWAIPAWSRQYGVACSTCHYPTPPRLNALGHRFRRAQFRNEDEFNKDPDWKEVKNYLSFRVRGRYEYSNAENAPPAGKTVSSGFKLNDATLFYAGPVTAHFTGFVELERPGDSSEIEAVVSAGGIWGKPDSFWTFRLGQFHTLTRVGWGGLDRPTGISTPDAVSRDLTAGGTGFKLNQDQVGLEGTYVHQNWRIIAQLLNGPKASDSSTTNHGDDNLSKEAMLAYELMWGDLASGFTAFAYHGTQNDPAIGGALEDSLDISRYGITASQVWDSGLELQGGLVMSQDDFDLSTATDVKGRGAWLELEYYLKKAKDLTLLARFDQTDNNTDVSDNTRTKLTAGFVIPVGSWHARWGLELRHINQDSPAGSRSTKEAVAELMLNF